MTMRKRLAALATTTILATGGALAVAGPAQAVDWQGCPSNDVCLRDGRYWTGATMNYYMPYLLDHPEGRWLYYAGFDNRANGAINHSGRGVVLCQGWGPAYGQSFGYCWTVPAYSKRDWTGYRPAWNTASWIKYAS